MYDVTALGEILIDFTPTGESENGNVLLEQNPGGAPANVIAACSKLGKKTAFIGKVGNDQFGAFLRNTLERVNIDATGLAKTNEANTTLAFVHLDESGDRSFSFYRNPGADAMLKIEDVDFDCIKKSKIFHFGSVSLTKQPASIATFAAATFAKENGVIVSFDPNLREPLWDNLDLAKELICKGLKLADLVKISEEELFFLTGKNDLFEGSRELCNQFSISLIFITLGEKGSFYRLGNLTGIVPGCSVKTVDTTGAGDGFLGGALNKILEKNLPFEQLTDKDLQEVVTFGNAVGALVTTQKGAILSMPTIDEINQLLKGEKE